MADIKRLNYFNGQFLVDKDFQDEQAYLISMRRLHNSVLDMWGVAQGLKVTKTGDKQVTVGAGVAIDKDGKEIVLLADQAVDLTAFGANAIVYLTIVYHELFDPADHYTSGGLDNYTRTTERPTVSPSTSVPATDGSVIALAKITLDAAGNVNAAAIDQTMQKPSGAKLVPGSVGPTELADGAVSSSKILGGQLFLSKLGVGTTNADERLTVVGGMRISDSDLWLRGTNDHNHGLGWYGSSKTFANTNVNGPVVYGDTGGALGTTSGQQKIALAWNSSGNLGIGTTSPYSQLHIRKDVAGALGPSLSLMNGAGAAGAGASLDFSGYDPGSANPPTVRIQSMDDGNFSSHLSILHKNPGAAANPLVESLRIWSSGSVDVGSPNPIRFSSVWSSFTDAVTNHAEISNDITTYKTLMIVGNKANGGIGGPRRVSVWDRLEINGDSVTTGSLGVGTQTPQAKIDVAGGDIRWGNSSRLQADQGGSIELGGDNNTAGAGTSYIDFHFSGQKQDYNARIINDVDGCLTYYADNGNGLRFSPVWTSFPDSAANRSEISNDTGTYKTLMLVGNKSAGGVRRVSVWDKLEVNGDQTITARIGVLGQPAAPRHAGWGGGIHTWDLEAEGTVYSKSAVLTGNQDLAENYCSDLPLEAGDVVSLDPDQDRIVRSPGANDELVLGVISSAPGFLLNSDCEVHEEENGKKPYPVALSGRAPCKVTDENGPIKRGDLLTSSSTPGYAMKAMPVGTNGQAHFQPGTLIGKALEALESGKGTIEIFVCLK